MIDVNKAIQLMNDFPIRRRTETLSLDDSGGRILAEEIKSPIPMPSFDNSAMDGFAINFESLSSDIEKSTVFKIAGESQAGTPFTKTFELAEPIRISTGAKIPVGCDTVIPIEDCVESKGKVQILKVRKKGQHVRKAGEEFTEGSILLTSGSVLGAPQIGLLASVGVQEVKVFARPNVTLLVTGDEINADSHDPSAGRIYDSNTPMMRRAIIASGAALIRSERIRDEYNMTMRAIERAAKESDLIICTGGVSVGPHDHVKAAAAEVGFKEIFWKILQKPGKPLFFASKDNTALVGLPGNPVSAFICFHYYVKRMINRQAGKAMELPTVCAKLKESIKNSSDRSQFFRVRLSQSEESVPIVTLVPKQGSHMLTSIGQADGYILVGAYEEFQLDQLINVYNFTE